MLKFLPFVRSLVVLAVLAASPVALADASTAREILDATGVRGGFVVRLGSTDGRLTASLRASDSYQVHGLARSAQALAESRAHVRSLGLYGPVSVDRLRGARLPYIDNLVNLLVAEDLGDVPMAEVLRVLVPNGVAYVKAGDAWTKTVKPRPSNIDDWTHYLHDSTGNPVAADDVVGPPRRLQWVGSPRWSRHHDRMASMSALVTAGGRLFKILDEGSRVSIQLPPRWTVIARDAFNGTMLWKRPIDAWHSHLWPLKSGPTQLARRLVATDREVYVTLGITAPLVALDAATGETLRTYAGSEGCEEILARDGRLFLVVNDGVSETAGFTPEFNVGDQGRVANEFFWNEAERRIVSYDASGEASVWSRETRVSPLTLVADDARVLFHDGERIVCLDRATGEPRWRSEPVSRRKKYTMNFGPRLVVYEDVVLFAGGDRRQLALRLEDGEELWSAQHPRSGYQSPEDVIVSGGLVWSAPTTSTRDSGVFTGRDPRTGEVKREFPPDVKTYWFHHRCYQAKATNKYLLPSRTGIEFVDHENKTWDINHWVRGGCLYGIMPANGLVYAPPHNCACYPEAKLFGFNALAPASSKSAPKAAPVSFTERGPAWGHEFAASPRAHDWPMFRHDALRSGATDSPLPKSLDGAKSWRAELRGRLSAPVVAEGLVLVAEIDAHSICALRESTGDVAWRYTTGGRIDSPPTVWQGRAIFGSADGSVYCVRVADGVLVWRTLAAPRDDRLMAFEQLESVWPVHGSVLVEKGVAYIVAGRSNFLDGGLRFVRLDAKTGRQIGKTSVIDEIDPETGLNIQARLQVLNMTAGLPDVLSSDGRWLFMRSQRLDHEGRRQELGPISGTPAEQGGAQHGEGAHLFAPMGFLDDTWFHRAYWVYGRSFAGGHAGYYQAGKFAPSGRLLVFDDDRVYGFGRKAQYYKWTTTMEHQLFAASTTPPLPERVQRRGGSMVRFTKSPSLDPSGQPIVVEAWVKAQRPNGVVVARGGPADGYSLFVSKGVPSFAVRASSKLVVARASKKKVVGQWAHLVGALTPEGEVQIWVDGELAQSKKSTTLIEKDPLQSLEIGADDGSAVGSYSSPNGFTGTIDEVRIYHGVLSAEEIATRSVDLGRAPAKNAKLVLACSFDDLDAKDASGNENHGKVSNAERGKGKLGNAFQFAGSRGGRRGGSHVVHYWANDLDIFVRGIVLANGALAVAGPPDVMDEEETFQQVIERDDAVTERLSRQEAALEGAEGGWLHVVSAKDGERMARHKIESLPIWDGLVAANGALVLVGTDGSVTRFVE